MDNVYLGSPEFDRILAEENRRYLNRMQENIRILKKNTPDPFRTVYGLVGEPRRVAPGWIESKADY